MKLTDLIGMNPIKNKWDYITLKFELFYKILIFHVNSHGPSKYGH